MAKKKKTDVPVEAVQELADKAPEAASIGGTQSKSTESDDSIEINIELLRKQRIHCVMPCFDGMVSESTFMSFMKFSALARQYGLNWSVDTIINDSLVSRARNSLVAKFLARPESTHIMFIDADIGWEPWHLLALADRDLDVVSGLYPMKALPIRWVLNSVPGKEPTADGLQEVSTVGCGFLLAKREVFTKLKQHPKVKQYVNDIGLPTDAGQHLYNFFDTDIRNGRYLSEDWAFSKNWTELGNKLWVDRRVLLRHAGRYDYALESQTNLINSFGPIYVNLMQKNGLVEILDKPREPQAKSPSVDRVIDFESTAELVAEPAIKLEVETKQVETEKPTAKKTAKKQKVKEEVVEATGDDGGSY